ncbi:sarcosine oxidase subunit gamma family protein (plasmid) [Vibrio pelagius]|uniref:Sarcosine oxidase subunit gamma family protein n=1 Tax=Vibrio pelagius TaxID=28169 RepID=A0ABY5GAK0_VIBPE|nr:sarcosine oxidase subunit gamma family protein [Vibrio pelagius]UTT87232.1 sarcosine oxidase subunit gamma family protein [Vibrio pelagius]
MHDKTLIREEKKEVLVDLMNQVPSGEIFGESPLHHVELEKLASMPADREGVILKEIKLVGHLTLRCNPEDKQVVEAVSSILGFPLPFEPLTSTEKGEYAARWISPDEWLITVPGLAAFDVESAFREQVKGHYSLVNGSGGSTILELSGLHAVDVLKKSTPIDLHLDEFPVGKVVSTVFAKSGAIIRRIDVNKFELVVRRSFADYIWLWIQDASLEFGLRIAK